MQSCVGTRGGVGSGAGRVTGIGPGIGWGVGARVVIGRVTVRVRRAAASSACTGDWLGAGSAWSGMVVVWTVMLLGLGWRGGVLDVCVVMWVLVGRVRGAT